MDKTFILSTLAVGGGSGDKNSTVRNAPSMLEHVDLPADFVLTLEEYENIRMPILKRFII